MRRRSGRIADGRCARDLLSGEADRSRGRLVNAHDEAREGRLAAARLADDADGLAGRDVEIDALDRAHDFLGAEEAVARQREVLDQAAHRQQRLGGLGWLDVDGRDDTFARSPSARSRAAAAARRIASPSSAPCVRAPAQGAPDARRTWRCGTDSAPRTGSRTGSRADRAARPRWWSAGACRGDAGRSAAPH